MPAPHAKSIVTWFAAATATVAFAPLAGASSAMADDDPLVVYLHDLEDVIGERFAEDTGLPVEIVKESGGDLLARIAAERNNPRWDVILFDGIGSLEGLRRDGLLMEGLESPNEANLTDDARSLIDENRAWLPVGMLASCVIAYRTDLVEEPPTSFDDLTDARFDGEIGQADPAVAAPAYPCVAGLHHQRGMDEARDLYSGILDNGLNVYRTNGPTRRALISGDISVALLSSPNTYAAIADGEPIEVVWPEEGAPASVIGVGIQADTDKHELAQAWVDWILEPETQQFLIDEGGSDGLFHPTAADASPRDDAPEPGLPHYVAPADWAADHEVEIKTWFADRAIQ